MSKRETFCFLTFQIIFQSHINILEKIVAAHQAAFVFFDLQKLFDQFDRNALFFADLFEQGAVFGAAFVYFFVYLKFFADSVREFYCKTDGSEIFVSASKIFRCSAVNANSAAPIFMRAPVERAILAKISRGILKFRYSIFSFGFET